MEQNAKIDLIRKQNKTCKKLRDNFQSSKIIQDNLARYFKLTFHLAKSFILSSIAFVLQETTFCTVLLQDLI